MKKLLFSLICILVFVGFVSAKTEIAYDWGEYQYASSYGGIYLDYIYNNEGSKMIFYTGNKIIYIKNDSDGKQLVRSSSNDQCVSSSASFSILEDEILCVNNDWNGTSYVNFLYVYDEEFNLLNTQELSDIYFEPLFANLKSENENYLVWGLNIYDKEKQIFVNLEDIIVNAPSFDLFVEEDSLENYYKCINEVLGNTHFANFYRYFDEIDNRDEIWNITYQDGYLSIVFYDEENDVYGVDVYNNDMELILSKILNGISFPKILIKDNKIFIYELMYYDETTEDYEDITYLVMHEYDMEGNLLKEHDLSTIIDGELSLHGKLKYWGREIFNVIPTDDGFVLTTHTVVSFKAYDPTLNEEDGIRGDFPTVQKYSFVYSVDTKENDNGTIEVDKSGSKTGEMVKYNVQPKDGYKLEKVIVTDDSGNTIEIKDSSFVMPSSNVTIEAIFVVDNPNTGVFLKVGIACIITFVCYFFIILKNMKVKQYE